MKRVDRRFFLTPLSESCLITSVVPCFHEHLQHNTVLSMNTFLQYIDISNFKSIQHIRLADCSRINLFIGRPNFGKSNILEAIGVLGLSHVQYNASRKITNFIRLENEAELFFDGNNEEKIIIDTNLIKATMEYAIPDDQITPSSKHLMIKICTHSDESLFAKREFFVNDKYDIRSLKKEDPLISSSLLSIKKYVFNPNVLYKKGISPFLIPPFGSNLLQVIETNKILKEELARLFEEYGLMLVFDKASHSLKIMKKRSGQDIFLLPYRSIADTLQRIIFFKAAIASNQRSVILFEEPEAHAFPPYIAHITQEMIHASTNQFFLSTHSPYVVTDLLEHCRDDLSIFLTDFNDGQTVIKKLSSAELDDIYQYGVDLFMNNELFA